MGNEDHKLHREIRAAAALKDALKATIGEDDETLRDMIEGETQLHEMIERVVLSIDEDGMLVTGLKSRIVELIERQKRIEDRISSKRAMIEQAMVIGEVQKLERPCFTLSLRSTPAKSNIEDESAIPSKFWTPQAPKLDRSAVLAALKDGEIVPGVTLSNGGIAVQIRMK